MSSRKNVPKAALNRIYFIDKKIREKKYPNTAKLAEEWEGISVSTISRDIDYMKNQLGAPIEYDAAKRGYYYSREAFRLLGGCTEDMNFFALSMAQTLLILYKGTPVYESVKLLLDEISAPLKSEQYDDKHDDWFVDDKKKNNAWFANRIIVPPVAFSEVRPEIWNVLVDAIKQNREVSFDYYNSFSNSGTKSEPRIVRPYQLLFDTGAWYLYGYSCERDAIRLFALSRMHNAALTEKTFQLPEDFDYRIADGDSHFGIFHGSKLNFKIKFIGWAAFVVSERKWAENQKIKTVEDGIIIEFSSSQYNKVLEWVLSRGAFAKPLAPARLVRDWQDQIKAMSKLAKEN